MRGRLRQLLERPISDRERGRVFAIVAVVLLLAAGALTLVAAPSNAPRAARDAPRPVHPTTASVPASLPTTATTTPTLPLERPPLATTRAGRRFLHDYLAFLYGHTRGRTFAAASRSLRRRLASRPPRVSPAMRRLHPHVARLTGHRLESRSRWVLTATIADGGAVRYPVELVIELRPSGAAVVTQLGGD